MAEQIENMDKKKAWKAILAVAVLLMIPFAPLIAIIICASIRQIEWYWSLFVFFSWSCPCEYFFFALSQFNKFKDKVKNTLTLVRNILVSVLLAFFILAVCCSWVTAQFVFGTLLIINGLWVVISRFLATYKPFALELILETLLSLGLTVYLIYLIPESENFGLREIVTAIVAAVYGGLLALVGVAWTIKRQDAIRIEDEKKKYRPIVNFHISKDSVINGAFMTAEDFDEGTESPFRQKEGTKKYLITNLFAINTGFIEFYLAGMVINKKIYYFTRKRYIDKSLIFGIDNGTPIYNNEKVEYLSLILQDLLGNEYKLPIRFQYLENDESKIIIKDIGFVCDMNTEECDEKF